MNEEQPADFPGRLDFLLTHYKVPGAQTSLTIRGVARMAGVSHTHISNLRRGTAHPNLAEIERLAAIFNVAPAWLAAFDNMPEDQVLRATASDPDIRAVVTQLTQHPLSAEGVAAILSMVRHIHTIESGKARQPGSAKT